MEGLIKMKRRVEEEETKRQVTVSECHAVAVSVCLRLSVVSKPGPAALRKGLTGNDVRAAARVWLEVWEYSKLTFPWFPGVPQNSLFVPFPFSLVSVGSLSAYVTGMWCEVREEWAATLLALVQGTLPFPESWSRNWVEPGAEKAHVGLVMAGFGGRAAHNWARVPG